MIATPTVTTDAEGIARFVIRSEDAGVASISATGVDDEGNQVSARLELEFVATDVASIFVDASPDILGPEGQTSTITAVVRDANDNLVKGETVEFTLSDVSGGTITPNIAVTDNNGIATTVYTSNAVSSEDAVMITAQSQSVPSVSNITTLTVGDRPFDISLGTGNILIVPDNDTTTYIKEFSAFVTDAAGRPVENVNLTASATPVKFSLGGTYRKGFWTFDTLNNLWFLTVTAVCPNEDINANGILDAGEDTNGDGMLTPGVIGAIRFQGWKFE